MSEIKHSHTLDIFNIMFKNNIVASYVGPIDGDILTMLGENIEQTLWRDESLRRRFFKIFIELSQNIALYSEQRIIIKDKEYGEGTFILSDYQDFFLFSAGNLVKKEDAQKLKTRIYEINASDRIGQRALKRKYRKLGNNIGGGNIGLVQVALLSKNPLDVCFFDTENSNLLFYLVSVRIEKG